jgi:carbohydrate-selective porin OprB
MRMMCKCGVVPKLALNAPTKWLALSDDRPDQPGQRQHRRAGAPLTMLPMEAETPAWVAPQVEHLFGDLGGVRTNLENRGIYLRLNAVAEFAGNVSGGVQRGTTSANQIAFNADVDWQRLAGVTGFSTHLIVVNRSGANTSHLFGDNVTPVQGDFWCRRRCRGASGFGLC